MEYFLKDSWKFKYCEYGQGEKDCYYGKYMDLGSWFDATLPGDVHLDMIAAGIIEEPFISDNARKCDWMEEKEWWYLKDFVITEDFIGEHMEIIFDGLDTTAEIWLNGLRIGEHNNAFIPYKIDITDRIRAGQNRIAVKLEFGPRSISHKDYKKYGGHAGVHFGWRTILRKPNFTNGWDWAPHLLTCGIWRGVSINSYSKCTIRDVHLMSELQNSQAIVNVNVELESFRKQEDKYSLRISMTHEEIFIKEMDIELHEGLNHVNTEIIINSPKLWWPAPIGQPNLYNVKVELLESEAKQLVDEYSLKYGIRVVHICRETVEEEGESFTIVVNGVKVYAKGANWVPADGILARVTEEKYTELIKYAKEANFNILRVWGGGIYEDPVFYRLCDEHGIMVWQDFMYACIFYADDDGTFINEIEREARMAVKRLRNHPSIVLWCGNNEIDQTYYNMTVTENEWFKENFFPVERFFGVSIFHEILPSICKELDPSRLYWPSSPFSKEGEDPNAFDMGDRHSWENGYRNYYKDKAKFASEYGVMSAPSIKSINEYMPEGEVELDSGLWSYHSNTSDPENKLIKDALRDFYKDPGEMEIDEYILASQWIQGEALKYSFEHYRRRKFINSGSMFWMYNDSWGTVGWSIVDYYLRKKASYYFVKRGYADILVSVKKEEDNKISVWVVNDLLEALDGRIELYRIAFDGSSEEKVYEACTCVGGNISQKCFIYGPVDMEDHKNSYYYVRYVNGDIVVSENWYFTDEWKNLNVPLCDVKYRMENIKENLYGLTVMSKSFCPLLFIEEDEIESIEDNAFYLNPGKEKHVTFMLKQNGSVNKIKLAGIGTSCKAEML